MKRRKIVKLAATATAGTALGVGIAVGGPGAALRDAYAYHDGIAIPNTIHLAWSYNGPGAMTGAANDGPGNTSWGGKNTAATHYVIWQPNTQQHLTINAV